jgi:hypothetical protein
MMTILISLIPFAAIILGFAYWDSPGIRVIVVGVILVSMWLGVGPLIAPHRLAEIEYQNGPPSDEWKSGSYETTKIVRTVYAPLISSTFALAALALFKGRSRKSKNSVSKDENG